MEIFAVVLFHLVIRFERLSKALFSIEQTAIRLVGDGLCIDLQCWEMPVDGSYAVGGGARALKWRKPRGVAAFPPELGISERDCGIATISVAGAMLYPSDERPAPLCFVLRHHPGWEWLPATRARKIL